MARTLEFEGKSTQDALDTAVSETGIPLSDLKFEVINPGGSGIFGLSFRKAKIKVFLGDETQNQEQPATRSHEPKKRRSRSRKKVEEERPAVSAAEQEPEPEMPEEAADEPPRSSWAQPSRITRPPAKKRKKLTVDDIIQPAVPKDRIDLDLRSGSPAVREKEPERPARTRQRSDDRGRSRGRSRPEREKPIEISLAPPPEINRTPPEGGEETHLDLARETLKDILGYWMPEAEVEKGWRDGKIYLNIVGDGSGLIIGRKGQTLDALQFVVSKIVDKKVGRHLRLMVDTEDYRGRREEALRRIAQDMAQRVAKNGRSQMTNLLNPHERRIIHLALQADGRFKTRSKGEGTYKRVIISLKS